MLQVAEIFRHELIAHLPKHQFRIQLEREECRDAITGIAGNILLVMTGIQEQIDKELRRVRPNKLARLRKVHRKRLAYFIEKFAWEYRYNVEMAKGANTSTHFDCDYASMPNGEAVAAAARKVHAQVRRTKKRHMLPYPIAA